MTVPKTDKWYVYCIRRGKVRVIGSGLSREQAERLYNSLKDKRDCGYTLEGMIPTIDRSGDNIAQTACKRCAAGCSSVAPQPRE